MRKGVSVLSSSRGYVSPILVSIIPFGNEYSKSKIHYFVSHLCFLDSCHFRTNSTNSDDHPEVWAGTSYTHDSGENCCEEFFQGHPDCEVVSVCSSDCCSKANEYDFSAELCQEDCFTTTTTTRPPTCDNYSRYWHPAKDGSMTW